MMKKLAMILIAMVSFAFVANAQQDRKRVQGDNNGNTVLVSVSEDNQTSAVLKFYNNSRKDVKVSVEIYNDQRSCIGNGTYTISGASEQRYHESERTISKIPASRICTSGCEVCSIRIIEAEAIN